ncbi:MAG: glycosyltransferase family 39 protein [Minisyncoccia bacterium]|jgi:4-amino-4-deoxy-L-arabinose transferase-like glycosyltransferase
MFKKTSSCLAWWTLALVCLASFSLMLWGSRTDSAIMDELAHIPAGYGYVHNFDYRLNPEHPPLIKALAMLPVLFLNPTFPVQSDAWQNQVNAQWDVGAQFLYQSGNDANAIIQTGRIFPILITLLVILFIYLLARGLMGNWWALLPAALFALDPTVLAHGHYVTTDVGAAFGVIFATYYFLKFVESPSTKHLWYAGLSFGVAQITKFSTPFLVPLFIFLAFVLWLRNVITEWPSMERSRRLKTFFMRGLRWLWRLVLIFAIGYVFIVYPIYFLFTVNYPITKQVSDTQFILGSFANGPTPTGAHCAGMRCLADLDIWMAKNPVLRPIAQYMLGVLMVFQRSAGGNTIYFWGRVAGSGGWTYFPLLFLLKEPIPTLIVVFAALVLAVWWMIRRDSHLGRRRGQRILDYIGVNLPEFSMASFIVLYWGYSMQSSLNIGFRHLMPTLPFIYILAAGVWKKWIANISFRTPPTGGVTMASLGTSIAAFLSAAAKSFVRASIKYLILIVLLVWLILETLFAAPYFLSYFNELGGGIWNGYHYVTDSNYDWGQDLLRLQAWVAAHPDVDKIAVDYFGGGNPHYYLGTKEVDWSSSKGNPADQGIHWLAVSVNTLEGAIQPLASGQVRNASDTYSWLTALRPADTNTPFFGDFIAPNMGTVPAPDYRAGTSIFIYHL